MKISSLFWEEGEEDGREGMFATLQLTKHATKTTWACEENLGHLIYLKKRGVLLFLITVKDGSSP